MKAIVMAGTTKEEFPGWSRAEIFPLDTTFGAGEVNVKESYGILTAGAQPSGGGIVAKGWDYTNQTGWQLFQVLTPIGTNQAISDTMGGGGGVFYRINWTPINNGPPPTPGDGDPPPPPPLPPPAAAG